MSWSQVKAQLKQLENEELVQLLHALYDLNEENQQFLAARLLAQSTTEMAAPYRQIISQALSVSYDDPTLDLRAARKALATFKKLGAGPAAQIELMLYYVEQGVSCASRYGDVHVPLYNSLNSCYQDAAALVRKLDDPGVTAELRPRFAQIARDVSDLNWGMLYDNFMDIYENYLQPDEDEDGAE